MNAPIPHIDTDLPRIVQLGESVINRIAAAGVSPADGMSPMAPISILSTTVKAKG